MGTKLEFDVVLNDFTDGVKDVFGDKLRDIVLFGSYARGDYEQTLILILRFLLILKEKKKIISLMILLH